GGARGRAPRRHTRPSPGRPCSRAACGCSRRGGHVRFRRSWLVARALKGTRAGIATPGMTLDHLVDRPEDALAPGRGHLDRHAVAEGEEGRLRLALLQLLDEARFHEAC